MKKLICLDFDGVIHSYSSGWQGASTISDPPVEGAIDFIVELLANGYDVAIYSSRSGSWRGRRAMKKWLRHWAGVCYGKTLGSGWSLAGCVIKIDSTHSERKKYASRWLIRKIKWPKHKPAAYLTIDDRAWTFEGVWPSLESVGKFKPWMQKKEINKSTKWIWEFNDIATFIESLKKYGFGSSQPIQKTKTCRGFNLLKFIDLYDQECSLQESSLADEDAIWLGVDNPDPKILASRAKEFGVETDKTTGWVSFLIPEEVNISTRMHLTREQVIKLLPHLVKFVETGEL